MITSRCTECSASSIDGVLTHADTCSATKPNVITAESREPAIELKFDSPTEQQAFMDKLTQGNGLITPDPNTNLRPSESPTTPKQSKDVDSSQAKPYLTTWCGGTGCDNCKLCLIFSGKAELIKADDKSHKLTYRITEE